MVFNSQSLNKFSDPRIWFCSIVTLNLVFNIPVSYIVDEETSQTLTSSNFNITYSIPNENPIASSIEIGSFTNDPGTGLQVIPVTVNAIEYASSTWQNLTGVKTVHFVISIVV